MLTAIRNLAVTRPKAKILKLNGTADCRLLTTSYTLKGVDEFLGLAVHWPIDSMIQVQDQIN